MQGQQSSQSKSSLSSSVKQKASISTGDRQCMVAEAAYFRALHRAFQCGDINDDGYRYCVDKRIDAAIAKMRAHQLYSYYCIKHTTINVINATVEMIRHYPKSFKGDGYEIE